MVSDEAFVWKQSRITEMGANTAVRDLGGIMSMARFRRRRERATLTARVNCLLQQSSRSPLELGMFHLHLWFAVHGLTH